MNDEAQLLVLIWESIQEYIPHKEKKEVASAIVRHMTEYGHDLQLLRDAEGEDNVLDTVLNEFIEEEDDDLFEDYEEEEEL